MKNRRPINQPKVMRKFTLIVLLTGFWCLGFAQVSETITSLKQQLTKPQADTSRVLLLNSLSRGYRNIRPDSAIFTVNVPLIWPTCDSNGWDRVSGN
jgi:hypothetical protein